RSPRAKPRRLLRQRAAPAGGRACRRPDARQGTRADRAPRARARRRLAGCRAALRHAEARRARPRARLAAEAAAAGRAGERPQSRGGRRDRRPDPQPARPTQAHRAAGRASHAAPHEPVRLGGGAQLRQAHRRGRAGGSAQPSRAGARLPRNAGMSALLVAKGLRASYGATRVLHGVDFELQEKSITALLGANGAGKTTTLRALCGMVRTEGEVRFAGRRIEGWRTEDIVRLGIAHVPDGRGTFLHLTTEENLRLGAYTRKDKSQVARDIELMYAYFPRLKERRRQQAGTLSGGEQQMLAVSRALMLGPKLLLLDEPSFGLAPLVVRELF